jgi:hypothetical protein
MKKLFEYASDLAIAAVAIGLLGYAIALVLAAFFSAEKGSLGARLADWLTTAPAPRLKISGYLAPQYQLSPSLRRVAHLMRTRAIQANPGAQSLP